MMDLNELRKVVDFMKETGLAELEYSDKRTSVRLRLAPPEPLSPLFGRKSTPAPEHQDAEVLNEEAPSFDVDELKSAAKSAYRKAATKASDGMESVAAYVKSRLGDNEIPEEEGEAPAQEEVKAPEAPETGDEMEEAVDETRESLKKAGKQAGEALLNTVKAGAILGKAGAKRGKERLASLFRPEVTADEDEDFDLPDDEE